MGRSQAESPSTPARFRTLKIGGGVSRGTAFEVRLLEAAPPDAGFYARFPGGLGERHPTLDAAREAAEARAPLVWRPTLVPHSGEKACPVCASPMTEWKRYPREVCPICVLEAVDSEGHAVRLFNETFLGTGFVMKREDGAGVAGATCFIRGIRCTGEEAYFGGIVVQLDAPEAAKPSEVAHATAQGPVTLFEGATLRLTHDAEERRMWIFDRTGAPRPRVVLYFDVHELHDVGVEEVDGARTAVFSGIFSLDPRTPSQKFYRLLVAPAQELQSLIEAIRAVVPLPNPKSRPPSPRRPPEAPIAPKVEPGHEHEPSTPSPSPLASPQPPTIPPIRDRRVVLERRADRDQWRVCIDGQPVPMTVQAIERGLTGSGHDYSRESTREPSTWIALDAYLRGSNVVVDDRPARALVTCESRPRTEIYNTVIYEHYTLMLELAADLSAVDVTLLEYSDGST